MDQQELSSAHDSQLERASSKQYLEDPTSTPVTVLNRTKPLREHKQRRLQLKLEHASPPQQQDNVPVASAKAQRHEGRCATQAGQSNLQDVAKDIVSGEQWRQCRQFRSFLKAYRWGKASSHPP